MLSVTYYAQNYLKVCYTNQGVSNILQTLQKVMVHMFFLAFRRAGVLISLNWFPKLVCYSCLGYSYILTLRIIPNLANIPRSFAKGHSYL